jgi:hypothetical protein
MKRKNLKEFKFEFEFNLKYGFTIASLYRYCPCTVASTVAL